VPPILVAGSVLSVVTVVVPGYLRPGWGAAVELATGAAALVTAWVMSRGVSAVVLLVMALGADATLAATSWCQAEPKATVALFALPTLTVALFGSSRLLLVQAPAAILGTATVLYLAGEPWPVLALHVVTAAYATSSPAAVVIYLRRRLDRALDREHELATTDPLTGLLNRRGFQSVIDNELARAERGGHTFSLLLCDCDFFKHLNDRLGHNAGDEALQAIGRLLDVHKRRIDVAARVGGEEFALVLPETDQHEAFIVAERLRSRFGQAFADQPVPLTMSLGVATYPVHGMSADALLRSSDEALYAAKSLGRDRTVLYSAEVQGILGLGNHEGSDRDHAQLATVLNLAEALDMRDTGTARHSQTVGRYCELMARELGLPAEQVERVRVAGVLHDIGKIGVTDAILRKAGPLTEDEFDQMKKHPEIGARILGGSGLNDIRGWILAHHERPDGRGYPSRLGDADIPIEAKILAVADSYEAMTSDRVYRKSIGAAAAREQLQECSGTQFDPQVVAAFLRVLDRTEAQATPSARS
jgi:diguanylate cyclase (GGDEF)-like protein/putative nucleotidyltransferase with HDIG domain